ncbi:MAG: amidohydrolase [Brevibacterium sp.]|uniref:amidohydrolase n=1 Tax=Brevibacterium sp. TaxID=1701 RepID=UPI0026495774|nr:amidohydrolase [Brevibacterium sp.]MDN5832282.1 amidohydrolase [Brevibacterium sp.]MDN5876548.1 amidohydrolase [Brevibacterium sp.]MDN5909116.1 amidohydrolase [Brevibacterium sp.]MDN6123307.1 amidohydrolase [Brevibacterium sp.]MDN6133943.1 amidohydrolase [Brevibacterium sp.]
MSLNTTLRDAISADLAQTVADYKDFHRTPELSMQETQTAATIRSKLEALGLETRTFGGTGIVSVIENGPGPIVAYRADIDGLPISEDTGYDYASTAEGTLPDGSTSPVMHGCGHDTHITVGLYLARHLVEHRELWSGSVIMIFQPGEETGEGARAMLDDGLWDSIARPEVIYGQHVWPGKTGHIYVAKGTAMAMSDCIKVTVKGKQAHGSQPESAVDPIVLGAYMITRLQSIVSREISGRDMAVVTVGTFHGGLKENIIPESAEFKLNIRTFNEEVRAVVLDRVQRIILAEAQASGAPEPLIEDMYRFPRCYNDPAATDQLLEALGAELGEEQVHLDQAVTGSEDFGAFGDDIDVPYVYWFFGGYSPAKFDGDEPPAGNHSPFFAPDDVETTLETGIRAALSAVLSTVGK